MAAMTRSRRSFRRRAFAPRPLPARAARAPAPVVPRISCSPPYVPSLSCCWAGPFCPVATTQPGIGPDGCFRRGTQRRTRPDARSSASSLHAAAADRDVARVVEDLPHERRPHDHPVGVGSDLGRLVAVADARAPRRPAGRCRAGPRHQLGAAGDGRAAAPVTPIARPRRRSRGWPAVAAIRSSVLRRCDQEDPVEVMRRRRLDPGRRLLRDQVRGDEPGAAGRGQVGGEAVDAVALDRVPVAHHHDGAPRCRHRSTVREDVCDAAAAAQGQVDGDLDRRPVHHRVGVGHADLDDVDAALDHRASIASTEPRSIGKPAGR